MKKITVLSLFNGMGTGRQAIEDLGIKIEKFYSSEIKKNAIKLAQFHFPDTIQLGNINNWRNWDIKWGSIDIILSGSPCQDLSIAGKRKGLSGSQSILFYVFIDILEHIRKFNSKILFFQENVGSAKISEVLKISEALNILPVRFNSNLVTAQNRDRYYWSNIRVRTDWTGYNYTDIPPPADQKLLLQDILTDGYADRNKANTLLASSGDCFKTQKKLYDRYKNKGMVNIVYLEKYKKLVTVKDGTLEIKTNTKSGFKIAQKGNIIDLSYPASKTRGGRVFPEKSPCLMADPGQKLFIFTGDNIRILNKTELCRLQGFPDNYCDILTRNQAANLLGDGWSLPMVKHFFKYLNIFN